MLFSYPGQDNPGNAVVTLSLTRLFGWLALLFVPLLVFALVVSFYGINIMGMPGDPLKDRPPGAVAGLPPAGNWAILNMPEQKDFLFNTALENNLPWQVIASICLIESEFGRSGSNYCGLSDAQWEKYYPLAYPGATASDPGGKSDPDKAMKVLALLLSRNGMGMNGDPGFKAALASFRPDGTYYYRVLQVAGRYSYILPHSFEEKLLDTAKSKLGAAYIWGASGPDNFDCSGLTMWAHAQLGVAIPRNSEAQYFAAVPVSDNQVMPGDMFFLEQTYPDPNIRITHVGFYLGGGLVLHAPEEGAVVKIETVDNSFFRQHWYGFARARRDGMVPPTNGLAEKSDALTGDYATFDITKGEPSPGAIDRYLSNCDGQGVRSPQLDEAPAGETIGQVYIRMGRKYGINPAYAGAFFTKESSCGTAGENLAAHDYGNIIWTPGYPRYPAEGLIAGHAWRSYLTWTDGMEDWFRLVKFEYVNRGLTRIDDIIPVYAPSSENNTQEYIEQVKARVRKIMA
ncbi:MAG TPA: NlpC/P60 family protein [Chloroflexia bacterium]|nr:NlpC/P60 family protein [Chloroflexia bacterium]